MDFNKNKKIQFGDGISDSLRAEILSEAKGHSLHYLWRVNVTVRCPFSYRDEPVEIRCIKVEDGVLTACNGCDSFHGTTECNQCVCRLCVFIQIEADNPEAP